MQEEADSRTERPAAGPDLPCAVQPDRAGL